MRSDVFVVTRPTLIRAKVGYWDMRAFGVVLLSAGLGAIGLGIGLSAVSDRPAWVILGAGTAIGAGGVYVIADNRTTFTIGERTVARVSFAF